MNINDLINLDLINLDCKATRKIDVLKTVAAMIHADERLHSQSGYYEGLIERENQFSTGIGFGVAIPHAKSSAVKKASITVIRLNKSLDWESIDDQPVDVIIGLAVPELNGGNTHLQIISKISMQIMEKNFVENMRRAKSKEEILTLVSNI
jgi:fructose-specific phosphotransferase system IIA component